MAVAVTTTLAWYIYTVNAHTTKLHMAAGTSVALQISNSPTGSFSSSVALEKFQGALTPVSTDRIQNGFQKVAGFETGSSGKLLARFFQKSREVEKDYYKTSLYLRCNSEELKIYLADIGFKDSVESNPISSAIRVGFVVPSTGREFIFEVTDKTHPQRDYNTHTGSDGSVLDSTKTDGSVVSFTALGKDNYCGYDNNTGRVTVKPGTTELCTLRGGADGSFGEPLQLDVYIWLEGCDADCVSLIADSTLTDLALMFAGGLPT